jgi:hypothetical protein
MGVSGQRHALAALWPRRKDPRYPLYRSLGGPQSRSGHREKNSFAFAGERSLIPGRLVRSQTQTEISFPIKRGSYSFMKNVYVIRETKKEGKNYIFLNTKVKREFFF